MTISNKSELVRVKLFTFINEQPPKKPVEKEPNQPTETEIERWRKILEEDKASKERAFKEGNPKSK